MAVAVLAVYGCGELPPPSTVDGSPDSDAIRVAPDVIVGAIEALDCAVIFGSDIDYAPGATGVTDIVAETRVTRAIVHKPAELIVVDGDRTAIVRDGRTIYIAQWFRTDAGGWLLSSSEACGAAASSSVP